MCNSRKSFDSFKKKDLVLLEVFISEMLKQVPEKSGETMTFCLSSNTLINAEEKNLNEKFKLRPKNGYILTLNHTVNFKVEFLASYSCKWTTVLCELYMTV